MNTPRTYRLAQILGTGSYGLVFQGVEATSGRTVALKKSRVSQRVRRPTLQYEGRILQLLQGHPTIPAIYGYGHLPHFEYLAMELLGSSIKDCVTGPVAVTTAVRVVLQMLSALEHIHKHGFVHRDIKPDNMLCSPEDPSKIVLIDFGISRRIKPGPPSKYDPQKDSRYVVGTLNWASLNAHNGIDLGPRDDLESLAYTVLSLLHGNLPWITSGFRNRSVKFNMQRIRESKAATSGDVLGSGFPPDFGYLLDYSRGLEYDQMPDYADLIGRFTELNGQAGKKDVEGPLEWRSVGVSVPNGGDSSEVPQREDGGESDDDDGNGDEGDGDEDEDFSNSYFNWDIADWDIQGARDRDLTFPVEQAELADKSIPQIIEVIE